MEGGHAGGPTVLRISGTERMRGCGSLPTDDSPEQQQSGADILLRQALAVCCPGAPWDDESPESDVVVAYIQSVTEAGEVVEYCL